MAALALCVVLALGWGARLARAHPVNALLLAVVLLVALANAAAIGIGGAVHARYQSRIAWLFPLAAGIALAAPRYASWRRNPASACNTSSGASSAR